jgi:oligoribonuclease
MSTAPDKLLWVDMEMTGLDPDEHRILEVAAIITDFKFNELALYQAYVKQPQTQLNKMKTAPWYDWSGGVKRLSGTVYEVAEKNGLINNLAKAGKSSKIVETELANLVKTHFNQQAILAGNSIHQDRRFIRRWWPNLEKLLHYRMLDVSSWKVFMHGRYGLDWKKPDEHKALEDIRGSIAELKYYSKKIKI